MPSPKPDDTIAGASTSLGSMPGRRLRAFARLVRRNDTELTLFTQETPADHCNVRGLGGQTYRQSLAALEHMPASDFLANLPLRTRDCFAANKMMHAIPENASPIQPANPSLHPALQDLGDAIVTDATEACAAFDDPHIWYPGVDEGIEPVSDEHVKLVVWAIGREVYREAGRLGKPAPPLTELPWHIQRALAERRRLRFSEWGIGHGEYQRGTFSLWNIPEDADWVPSRLYGDS